jgi:hypothetical protein
LLILVLLPGAAFWLAAGPAWRSRLDAAEALYLILVSGVALLSWPTVLLAELGRFSLTTLALASLLASAWLALWAIWRRRVRGLLPGQRLWRGHVLLLLLLALAVWLMPRPFPYLVGGRDHGNYVNTGLHIARSGGILIDDADLAALPAGSRPLLTNPEVDIRPALVPGPWSEGQRLPGLTIRDGAAGVVAPHGFHLYPVWIAIFAAVGGIAPGLWATPALSLLGSLGVYFAGSRLFGRRAALLALLLVIVNVGQSWFQAYPTAEILVRALFWAGLWAGLVMLVEGSGAAAALSALCLGLLHLSKLDTLFVPAVLLPLLLYAALSGRWRRDYTIFVLVYLVLIAHALVHALTIATIYTLDQVTRVLLPGPVAARIIAQVGTAREPAAIAARLLAGGWPLLIGAAAVALLASALLWWARASYRPGLARLGQHGGWLLLLIVALPVLLLAYAGLVYPWWPVPGLAATAETVTVTGWYLLPAGLLLGLVGLLQGFAGDLMAKTSAARSRVPAWLLLFGNVLPLFLLGSGTYPDHFWAARRFVPVLFPALLLGAGGVVTLLAVEAGRRWVRWLLPAALAVALVAGTLQATMPVARAAEYAGLPAQLEALADDFAAGDVLLFLPGDEANRVALPLWLLHEQTVFQLRPEALAEPALAAQVAAWESGGRPVYLLYSSRDAPWLDGLVAEYQFSRQIAVPQVELTVAGLPARTGHYTAMFTIFRLRPAATSGALPVATLQPVPGSGYEMASSGLYAPHTLSGLPPVTWTGEMATLTLPAVPGAEQLILQLGSGRPEELPPPTVQVTVDGQPVTAAVVTEPAALFEWALPAAIGGKQVTVAITTEPWVPAESGYGSDGRSLGVLFYGARLAGR